MTETQRQEILNNIVIHMMAQNCTWQQIVAVREVMWREIGRHVKADKTGDAR